MRKTMMLMLAASALTAACGNSAAPVGAAKFASLDEFFAARVQPRLEFCRNCHVPGGIADVEHGRKLMLATDKDQDLANLRASWERLGRNDDPPSRILRMPAGEDRPHSGGTPWPRGSQAYLDVETLLYCFEDPAGCLARINGGAVDELPPLLGSTHGRSYAAAFCAGRPDGAELPPDPRARVRPGVNAGRAVHFNAFHDDCHGPQNPFQRARTCGQWRERVAQGERLLASEALITLSFLDAARYDTLWQSWGLAQRPADFDQQITERYGWNPAPFRNPYPRPGEDPAATGGGSGQLPLGLIQLKDADGHYNGQIGVSCYGCHGGRIGSEAEGLGSVPGMGNANIEFELFTHDILRSGGFPVPLPYPHNATRGTVNAVSDFEFLMLLRDFDTLDLRPDTVRMLPLHSAPGDQDAPMWWNAGERPREYMDGGVSSDSTRSLMMFLTADIESKQDGAQIMAAEAAFENIRAFVDSREAPAYPRTIDTALAERGAILFHAKDLWARAPAARPPGNGSCASCHGVYSPRYAQDPAYLEHPDLAGIAGYIVPLSVIGTDPGRVGNLDNRLRYGWGTTWFGYPDHVDGYLAPTQKDPLTEFFDDYFGYVDEPGFGDLLGATRTQGTCGWERQTIGYLAPPLHGVWASAPYLHNGSVPDVWGILQPEARPALWARPLTAGPGSEHGYDQSLAAYDFERMGWKYRVPACSSDPGLPYLHCDPQQPLFEPGLRTLSAQQGGAVWHGWQYPPPATRELVEQRKLFNSFIYGKSNAGHAFTSALSDAERRAIIEFLKTL